MSVLLIAACFAQNADPSFLKDMGQPKFDPMSKIPITIISLILVGALAYLVLKFMGSKNLLPKMQGRAVKVIERQYLSPKQYLCIVKVLDEYLLVGVADNSINTLKELDKESVENFLNDKPQANQVEVKDYWAKFFAARIPFGKK